MGGLFVGAAVEGFEFGTVHGAEEVAHVDEVELVGPGSRSPMSLLLV